MGVKRFDYILGTGPEEGWMEEAAHGQYVKASDYDALAAELAAVRSDRQREHDLRVKIAGDLEECIGNCADPNDKRRIRELEAFLVKVLPPGIEDGCDECGGDLAKCHAENPDCYIAEARRLLPVSVPETVAEDLPCDHCGHGVDMHVGVSMPCPGGRKEYKSDRGTKL